MTMRPLQMLRGHISALLLYPLTERFEKRDIRSRLAELRRYYKMPYAQRKKADAVRLADIVEYAGQHVPYYRDLFKARQVDPAKLRSDTRYLADIPCLTKDIIREQGTRMLSQPLAGLRHHLCKTGGSTGASCSFYYDQAAADYSAAVTLFAREKAGKKKHAFELHFASRFPEVFPLKARLREHVKCLAMNRYNLFFDRLDDKGLEEIWRYLQKRQAYMVHAHPSTLYALACYIERTRGTGKAFEIFESSGELLEPYMREKIAHALKCRVIDRYGLAEFGIIAYQTEPDDARLMVLDSEGWIETLPATSADEQSEIVFTGFRNRLMPLIRYQTGDKGQLTQTENGAFLDQMLGRIHDMVPIGSVNYPTHYVQDVLDRIGGIQEFQIDLRETPPRLLIVPEASASREQIKTQLDNWWKDGIRVEFGSLADVIRVGHRAKFRHVVSSGTP